MSPIFIFIFNMKIDVGLIGGQTAIMGLSPSKCRRANSPLPGAEIICGMMVGR